MEDDAVIFNNNDLGGFSFAAVFDCHAGFSSVNFLREELYKECVQALQGGQLLNITDFSGIKNALQAAFESADAKIVNWLEINGEDDESGATATAMLVGNDMLFISHVGDSCAVLSQSGKAQELTNSHRTYGRNKVSLQEIKRIREAGGWISDGRICGDLSVNTIFYTKIAFREAVDLPLTHHELYKQTLQVVFCLMVYMGCRSFYMQILGVVLTKIDLHVLQAENTNYKVKVIELEDEVNKLLGQQNLQQHIHHQL